MKKKLLKKTIALFSVLSLLFSTFSFGVFAVSENDYQSPTSGVQSAVSNTDPSQAVWNEIITFTVVTDTNASKVKISKDGSVYLLADILKGFSSYTDSGNVRTWTITHRVEIIPTSPLYFYAGNPRYDYGSKYAVIGTENETDEELSDMTAKELVALMDIGWNIGNSLDSHGEWIDLYTDQTTQDYETAWNNPVTTKALIDAVKTAGFDTVRVPVTWYQHLDENNNIKADWMARVKEVVDYGIDNDMFVILNTHHEDARINLNGSIQYNEMESMLVSVWTQIANEFANYDQHLIFEVLNEPRNVGDSNEWNGGTASARAMLNDLNTAALAAIRSTGGKNTKRCVMLPSYAASVSDTVLSELNVPDDDFIIISMHAYTPYSFCTDASAEFTSSVENDVRYLFSVIESFRDSHDNIPVIIGEYGCYKKTSEQNRIDWVTYYLETAKTAGIPCIIWDNGAEAEYKIIDRSTYTVSEPNYVNAITEIFGR